MTSKGKPLGQSGPWSCADFVLRRKRGLVEEEDKDNYLDVKRSSQFVFWSIQTGVGKGGVRV